MHPPIERPAAHAAVERDLRQFPAVAILGPRQCGKTTLARALATARPGAVWLDLERPSDVAKLHDPEAFLRRHQAELVVLDEVQRVPALFQVLRSLVDEHRVAGRFLILGSASPALLRQASETLAGRLAVQELTPFLHGEVVPAPLSEADLWLRGGFPDSALASDDASFRWREAYIRTFLERDVPQLGFRIPAATLGRFWTMCAHLHGQVLNLSALGRALGESHTTARHHLDVLEQTFLARSLPAFAANVGKRLVKSPKLYLRDSGLVHALLGLGSHDDLAGHPVVGASWEGFVIEQLLAANPRWRASYYRTAKGEELDLVLERAGRRIAVECKVSSAPSITRGFWTALRDLEIAEALVVAPVATGFPIGPGVDVVPLTEALSRLS